MDDPTATPAGLPIPADDCAAAHLAGMVVPRIPLLTTEGTTMLLGDVGPNARRVVYPYPRTGRPNEPPLSEDGDLILGSRGCTPEACAFRGHHADLARAGADVRPGAQMPLGFLITRALQSRLSRTMLRVDLRNCQDEASGSSQGTKGFFR
jgi:hypothetical protein